MESGVKGRAGNMARGVNGVLNVVRRRRIYLGLGEFVDLQTKGSTIQNQLQRKMEERRSKVGRFITKKIY